MSASRGCNTPSLKARAKGVFGMGLGMGKQEGIIDTAALNRRAFLFRVVGTGAAGSAVLLSGCGTDDGPIPEFKFGVASGDPLADRVVIWTHARFPDRLDDVPLEWEVATDSSFTSLAASGQAVARAEHGHTVKVDVGGLRPGTSYFYRFRYAGVLSPTGQTRTLPTGQVERIRLAVFSCSNYPAGFFHAYAEAVRSGAEFALHLGDYIYEYGASGYASADAQQLGRVVDPPHECLTLSDYRRRYALYRSDPDLQALHAAMPMIAVWDDHEVANDAWREGAENHTEGSEGRYVERRQAALRAWLEWMPVRAPNPNDLREGYRAFDFGNLFSLYMLETRHLARDLQVRFSDLLNPATAASARSTLTSPSRRLLGETQLNWLRDRMSASRGAWQVLGQQTLMARMWFPVSVLRHLNPDNLTPAGVAAAQEAVAAYLAAKATAATNPAALTAEQRALLDPTLNPRLGYNLDAWDGYPAERERVLMLARSLGKRLISLAGDTHNAWASDLTLADGSVVGHEFATPAVSSPGLENVLASLPPAQTRQIFLGVVDDLKLADTERRGFLLVEITPSSVSGTMHLLSTVKSRTYTVDRTLRRTVSAS
ncbi:MAG: alkaline phosphatase D family protein [Casimicrobiaceae bacterium]|nr:alkaline phosphatase D family protein [Casimicrobiaceae bacterium]